jgi:hypothetical protein
VTRARECAKFHAPSRINVGTKQRMRNRKQETEKEKPIKPKTVDNVPISPVLNFEFRVSGFSFSLTEWPHD